jgi:hypothetical protein
MIPLHYHKYETDSTHKTTSLGVYIPDARDCLKSFHTSDRPPPRTLKSAPAHLRLCALLRLHKNAHTCRTLDPHCAHVLPETHPTHHPTRHLRVHRTRPPCPNSECPAVCQVDGITIDSAQRFTSPPATDTSRVGMPHTTQALTS